MNSPKRLTVYVHYCLRCRKTWESKSRSPMRCGKCKSGYWNREKKNGA